MSYELGRMKLAAIGLRKETVFRGQEGKIKESGKCRNCRIDCDCTGSSIRAEVIFQVERTCMNSKLLVSISALLLIFAGFTALTWADDASLASRITVLRPTTNA